MVNPCADTLVPLTGHKIILGRASRKWLNLTNVWLLEILRKRNWMRMIGVLQPFPLFLIAQSVHDNAAFFVKIKFAFRRFVNP